MLNLQTYLCLTFVVISFSSLNTLKEAIDSEFPQWHKSSLLTCISVIPGKVDMSKLLYPKKSIRKYTFYLIVVELLFCILTNFYIAESSMSHDKILSKEIEDKMPSVEHLNATIVHVCRHVWTSHCQYSRFLPPTFSFGLSQWSPS